MMEALTPFVARTDLSAHEPRRDPQPVSSQAWLMPLLVWSILPGLFAPLLALMLARPAHAQTQTQEQAVPRRTVQKSAGVPPLPDLALDRFPPASRAAIQPALDAARRATNDQAIVGRLGMTLQAWEQWEAAHATFLRARGLAGDRFRWAYLDAIVLQRLGRPEEAAAALKAALAARPDYLPARAKLAEALFDAGQADASARAFSALLKEPAAEPAAQFGLGRIAAAAGRHEEAIAHLQRAIALFPEYGAAHYALARSARALGRVDEAQQALKGHQAFGARWPGLPDPVLADVAALRSDARAALQRGRKLADAGEVTEAIAAYEEALTLDQPLQSQASAQAHAGLVSLYGRAKDWTRAETHYRAAIAFGAELEEAHYNYGVLLGLQDRWDESAAAYRQVLAINPRHPQAHNNLGHVLERSRAFDEAAAEYRRALEASPDFRLARFNLGRMLIALKRPQEAIAQLERLTQPRDAEAAPYLFALATAYIHTGQQDQGRKWASEARRLALEHGQQALAAAIDRELSRLK